VVIIDGGIENIKSEVSRIGSANFGTIWKAKERVSKRGNSFSDGAEGGILRY
jgi:hypothetical protein